MSVPLAGTELPTALLARMRLGTATSAYQIEGAVAEDGRTDSIWDVFGRRPGVIAGGVAGETACDHYHRWHHDLDLMAGLGIESYRFSVSWPRVIRQSGGVNQAGLDFYDRLTDGLLARGIEPITTLYHWDLPQWIEDEGGWRVRSTTERFADYASVTADRLGDRVRSWITHNEPFVTAFAGHAEGRKAPGEKSWPTAITVSHHLLLSHGLAVSRIRAAAPGTQVGITLNLSPIRAATDRPDDVAAAERFDEYLNRWFLDPVFRGRYPAGLLAYYECRYGLLEAIHEEDLPLIAEPMDFLGVNYYFPHHISAAPGESPLDLRHEPPSGPTTQMGWPMDAPALTELLLRLYRDYPAVPIWITENGTAVADPAPANGTVADPLRVSFLRDHLQATLDAVAAGVPVERYLIWSLLDNFEWEFGYAPRFGIVHVDYETQARIPKDSARWLHSVIASRPTPPVTRGRL